MGGCKRKKENTNALIATHKRALSDLTRAMDETLVDLVQLVDDYDGSTLSMSFSAHMVKTIQFVEQRYTDREEGVSQEGLENMRYRLEKDTGPQDCPRRKDGIASRRSRGALLASGSGTMYRLPSGT